jgi:hypothetical protein
MPGELVQAATVLAGSGVGGWFADKIFGSSVGAMGDQLKVYLQSRLPAIFGVAEAKAQEHGISPTPIQPGLLARMIVDASFSADQSDITNWWANLFIDASIAGSNRHAVFSDMMAMIGPSEARCLSEFVGTFDFARNAAWFARDMPNILDHVDLIRDEAIAHWVGETPIHQDRIHEVYVNLTRGQIPWPLRPVRWSLPAMNDGGQPSRLNQTNPWYRENRESIEILERTRVMKFSKVDIPVMESSSWVDTAELTGLGADFFAACNGYRLEA